MIAVAWAISYNRKLFPWRTVVWGVGLQFILALLILKTPWGGALFDLCRQGDSETNPILQRRLQICFRPAGG